MLILTHRLKVRSGRWLSLELYQNVGILDSKNDLIVDLDAVALVM